MKTIICKTCDPLRGNGYCASHSTSGMAYLVEEVPPKPPLKGWGCVLSDNLVVSIG